MPPSPTAAAKRFTDAERTSPAERIPGQLVPSGPGEGLMPFHAGALTTAWPVLIKPFSSRSTMMTSTRPIEEWGKLLSDVSAAGAILDRLLHHVEIFKTSLEMSAFS